MSAQAKLCAALPTPHGSRYICGIMNAVPMPLSFASAYRQLSAVEKAWVDGYVANAERDAAANRERISNVLARPVPLAVIEGSRGIFDKPLVRAAIVERIEDLARQSELTAWRVVKEIQTLAFSNVGDYFEIREDGSPEIALHQCTPDQLAAIQSIDIEEESGRNGLKRKIKFKLHDKTANLINLAKYMGLLEAENPHWRAESAKPVNSATIAVDASDEKAAELYGNYVNG